MKYDKSFIEAVREIEVRCFARPWSLVSIGLTMGAGNSIFFSEELSDKLIGFILGTEIAGDFELYRIAVIPELSRKGIGEGLIRRFIGECKRINPSGEVFLEVSSANISALRLYEKSGFEVTGVRKGYYDDGSDGLNMRLKL